MLYMNRQDNPIILAQPLYESHTFYEGKGNWERCHCCEIQHRHIQYVLEKNEQ